MLEEQLVLQILKEKYPLEEGDLEGASARIKELEARVAELEAELEMTKAKVQKAELDQKSFYLVEAVKKAEPQKMSKVDSDAETTASEDEAEKQEAKKTATTEAVEIVEPVPSNLTKGKGKGTGKGKKGCSGPAPPAPPALECLSTEKCEEQVDQGKECAPIIPVKGKGKRPSIGIKGGAAPPAKGGSKGKGKGKGFARPPGAPDVAAELCPEDMESPALHWSMLSVEVYKKSLFLKAEAHLTTTSRFNDRSGLIQKFFRPKKTSEQAAIVPRKKTVQEEVPKLLEDREKVRCVEILLQSQSAEARVSAASLDKLMTSSTTPRPEDLDLLHRVSMFAPTVDEQRQLDKYDLLPEEMQGKVGRAERFLVSLGKVEKFAQRAKATVLLVEVPDTAERLRQRLAAAEKAAHCLLSSDALVAGFTLLVKLGNLVNAGTSKGRCFGFNLESLQMLCNRASVTDKKYSLLNAWCEELSAENDTTLSDIEEVLAGCKCLGKVVKNLPEFEKEVLQLKEDADFLRKSEFVTVPNEQSDAVAAVAGKLRELQNTVLTLPTYFAATQKLTDVGELLSFLDEFGMLVGKARLENMTKRNAEEKARKRASLMKKKNDASKAAFQGKSEPF